MDDPEQVAVIGVAVAAVTPILISKTVGESLRDDLVAGSDVVDAGEDEFVPPDLTSVLADVAKSAASILEKARNDQEWKNEGDALSGVVDAVDRLRGA